MKYVRFSVCTAAVALLVACNSLVGNDPEETERIGATARELANAATAGLSERDGSVIWRDVGSFYEVRLDGGRHPLLVGLVGVLRASVGDRARPAGRTWPFQESASSRRYARAVETRHVVERCVSKDFRRSGDLRCLR